MHFRLWGVMQMLLIKHLFELGMVFLQTTETENLIYFSHKAFAFFDNWWIIFLTFILSFRYDSLSCMPYRLDITRAAQFSLLMSFAFLIYIFLKNIWTDEWNNALSRNCCNHKGCADTGKKLAPEISQTRKPIYLILAGIGVREHLNYSGRKVKAIIIWFYVDFYFSLHLSSNYALKHTYFIPFDENIFKIFGLYDCETHNTC